MKPQDDYQFWVYILASRSRTLYIGVTNALRSRVIKHRQQTPGTFTTRYKSRASSTSSTSNTSTTP